MKNKKISLIIVFLLIVANLFTVVSCGTTTKTEETRATSEVSINDSKAVEQPGNPQEMPPGGGAGEVDHGTYAILVEEDSSDVTYESTRDSENAIRIEKSTVTLENAIISKTSGETGSGDNSNFYGINAGLLALDGADVTLNKVVVNTTTEGSNGIFSYGEGTTVTINNGKIYTSNNSAGGVMVTGGGTMYVNNSNVETQGDHSAALRTDRGGGTLIVDGGTYLSNGIGSPAIYSTAKISVNNGVLEATNSEALVIEGKNSIILTDCDVNGNMTSSNSDSIHNVMIYQSMSGDADTGTSEFSMINGSLTANKGDMIYVTNTSCVINLTKTTLNLYNDVLLNIAGNSSNNWGTPGSNGGQCVFTANNQTLTGKMLVDEISSLKLNLTEGTAFSGSINSENEGGEVLVNLDSISKWSLSGDSYISELTGSTENIDFGGHTLYVNGIAFN